MGNGESNGEGTTKMKEKLGLYELQSKLLVSPLITPIVVPCIGPYITPSKDCRLWLISSAQCPHKTSINCRRHPLEPLARFSARSFSEASCSHPSLGPTVDGGNLTPLNPEFPYSGVPNGARFLVLGFGIIKSTQAI